MKACLRQIDHDNDNYGGGAFLLLNISHQQRVQRTLDTGTTTRAYVLGTQQQRASVMEVATTLVNGEQL